MAVTSIVRDRGRVLGIAVALAVSATLVAAPMAFGAGDQVASGKLSLKVTKGFKRALKHNGVRMGPKNFKIRPNSSRLDPTLGVGRLTLKGKLKFIGHGKRVVARQLIAKLGLDGGNLKGKINGSTKTLFRLRSKPSGIDVTRVGFGAKVSTISARLGDGLAKVVNRKLGLHSLTTSRQVAKVSFNEQPKTVEVTGGTVFLDIPIGYLPNNGTVVLPGSGADPNTVAGKSPYHCLDPASVSVIARDPGDPDTAEPARLTTVTTADPVLGPPPSGVGARFRFPVTGGTVGPTGQAGVIHVRGGVRLATGQTGIGNLVFPQPAACGTEAPGETTSTSILDTQSLAPNLEQLNVQANTTVGGTSPGCNGTGLACGPAVFGGNKGVAIGQVIDGSAITVSADPNAKTVTINGGLIKNNQTATAVLNGLFPNASGDPSRDFVDGDKFAISSVSVSTR